ncbi:Surfactin synthase thioesterase subunit [Actinokineospora alba]|uniref:Surfactin synthase thioesterase subunit n=1 Tax=Actinokineospora alba TaxID=504798 RepID=A0A1H0M8R7_9PSEU|nr:alpha/beta fold hydrolase [Actinokineospora alba]TDP67628.1 surfactin synthase thioesterase subunit [Actinokineospora alba]SDI44184.1 Surfactin synthase thioesterase subunit [Actinokineospora alba]SDO76725.1 Surfactin synthase thioesterase subunit [Actinokineospora alba]
MSSATDPPFRLVCLPPAGGSAATFKPWVAGLGPEFAVDAVDVRGRAGSLVEVAADLAHSIAAPGRYALVGHSLGGLLAFEIAKRIADSGLPAPEFAVVAGSRPPHRSSSRVFAPLLSLDDDRLIDALASMGAVNPLLRKSPLRGLFMPALRADLELIVGYSGPAEAVSVPLVAWHGVDDPLASPALGLEWARYAAAGFTHAAVEGGHFFLYERVSVVRGLLRQLVGLPVAGTSGGRFPIGA